MSLPPPIRHAGSFGPVNTCRCVSSCSSADVGCSANGCSANGRAAAGRR